MAYDEDLANRVRELIGADPTVTEKKMFGGLAFLLNGNMAVSASGRGGLMVRVNPDQSAVWTASGEAETMIMQGREMPGWVRVLPEHVRTKRQLAKWVDRGTGYARSLPAKDPRPTKTKSR